MIIGISGKKQSGKDTVGKIFQYYSVHPSKRPKDIEEWLVFGYALYNPVLTKTRFLENKKFAEKLKQFVGNILGIKRKDLEREEIKNMVLPPYWDRWIVKVDDIQHLFATEEEAIKFFNSILPDPYKHLLPPVRQSITVRQMLQWVGTEAMRDRIHPNIWVYGTFVDYKPVDEDLRSNSKNEFQRIKLYPNWLFTDVRFPNEADSIRNGVLGKIDKDSDFRYLIRVDRPGVIRPSDEHESETALDDYKHFNTTIVNDGSLDDLVTKVYRMLKRNKKLSSYFYLKEK